MASSPTTTRRNIVGTAGLLLASAAIPAAALAMPSASPGVMADAPRRYEEARDRLNNSHTLSQEAEDALADAYLARLTDLEATPAGTPLDFLRKYVAIFDEGACSTQEHRLSMLAEARSILAREGC